MKSSFIVKVEEVEFPAFPLHKFSIFHVYPLLHNRQVFNYKSPEVAKLI